MHTGGDQSPDKIIHVAGGQLGAETLTMRCVASSHPSVIAVGDVAIGAVNDGTGAVVLYATSGPDAAEVTITLGVTSALGSNFLTERTTTFVVRVFRTCCLS